jgi:hypothetical protein
LLTSRTTRTTPSTEPLVRCELRRL